MNITQQLFCIESILSYIQAYIFDRRNQAPQVANDARASTGNGSGKFQTLYCSMLPAVSVFQKPMHSNDQS